MKLAPKRSRWWLRIVLAGGVGTCLAAVGFLGLAVVIILGFVGGQTSTGAASASMDLAPYYSAGCMPPKVRIPTSGQLEFCGAVAICSRLDPLVAMAWTVAEGGGVNPGQPPNNFLFLTAATGGFRSFASPEEAAQAVCQTLAAPDYEGILASASQPPILQLIAIAESSWDGGHVAWGDPVGHYGGMGQNLTNAYYSLLGDNSCQRKASPC